VSLEALFHGVVGDRGGRRLIHDDDIETGQVFWVLSKRLSNHPFNTVARCSFTTVLFRDRKTEPSGLIIAFSAKHCKQFIPAACRFLEHAAERRSRKQAIRLLESVCSAARQA
jgi:hypothetical protein